MNFNFKLIIYIYAKGGVGETPKEKWNILSPLFWLRQIGKMFGCTEVVI